jgi:hypothetical protein
MATPLSEFHEFLRVTLGDLNADAQNYSPDNFNAALRMAILKGELPGYALTAARDALTPTLTDANDWARLLTLAALTFVRPEAERTSYRTRAMSESFGGRTHLLFALEDDLHRLEERALFRSGVDGWTDFKSFCAAVGFSLPLWAVLTEVKTGPGFAAEVTIP